MVSSVLWCVFVQIQCNVYIYSYVHKCSHSNHCVLSYESNQTLFLFIFLSGSFESQGVIDDAALFNTSCAFDDVTKPCIYGYDDDSDVFDQPVDNDFGDFIFTDDCQELWNLKYDEYQDDWSKSYEYFFDTYYVTSASPRYRYRFIPMITLFPTSDVAVRYRDRVCVPLTNGDAFNYLLSEYGFCQRNASDTRIRINPLLTPDAFISLDDMIDPLWIDMAEVLFHLQIHGWLLYLHVFLEDVVLVLFFTRKKIIALNSKGLHVHYRKRKHRRRR